LRHPIPFPSDGLRRISINSFGYGGANAHAVVDDAFNFFRVKGRSGKHCTIESPPSQGGQSLQKVKASNGQAELEMLNSQTVHRAKDHGPERPVVLLWTAADEAGINRLAEVYADYFSRLPTMSEQDQTRYLANLSYTLSSRRSNLPWKSFSVIRNIEHVQSSFATALSKPMRSSAAPSISFVFTGQGAQWYAMARGLTMYPVFSESLRKSANYLDQVGCEWALISRFLRFVISGC
jgi:acyl transferase domain-containing protein